MAAWCTQIYVLRCHLVQEAEIWQQEKHKFQWPYPRFSGLAVYGIAEIYDPRCRLIPEIEIWRLQIGIYDLAILTIEI